MIRGAVFPVVLAALFVAAPLFAADRSGSKPAARESGVRFVLEKGTLPVKGIPGFGENAFEAIYGAFSMEGRAGTSIEVWATREVLFTKSSEWTSRTSGSYRLLEREPLSLLDRGGGSGWSVLVRWPAVFPVSDRDLFLSLFMDRFSYFVSLARSPSDVSFPAVLER